MQRLPGDKTHSDIIEEIIRVDHAGEYAAKKIYEGQLRVMKKGKARQLVQEMLHQELEHLDYFSSELKKRHIRPTILSPIWDIAAFSLGKVTGLMGAKAAMACTEAVEEVINEHYLEQINYLENVATEKELLEKIKKFRDDEIHHQEVAVQNDARGAFGYKMLTSVIKLGCKAAIRLTKKY